MKKYDFLLIFICIACFIVLPVAVKLRGGFKYDNTSLQVNVYSMGELYGIYSLSTDDNIHVSGRWGFNDILIHDGCVSVSDSDCSNGLCVDSKPICNSGESIACLPHGLFVIITASSDDYLIDGVAY